MSPLLTVRGGAVDAFAEMLSEFTAFSARYARCAERLATRDLIPVLKSCTAGIQTAARSLEKRLIQRYNSADGDGKTYLDQMARDTGAILMLRDANKVLTASGMVGTRQGMVALLDLHNRCGRLLRELLAVERGSAAGELFAWLESALGGIPAILIEPDPQAQQSPSAAGRTTAKRKRKAPPTP
jgi:hypothetical protein